MIKDVILVEPLIPTQWLSNFVRHELIQEVVFPPIRQFPCVLGMGF